MPPRPHTFVVDRINYIPTESEQEFVARLQPLWYKQTWKIKQLKLIFSTLVRTLHYPIHFSLLCWSTFIVLTKLTWSSPKLTCLAPSPTPVNPKLNCPYGWLTYITRQAERYTKMWLVVPQTHCVILLKSFNGSLYCFNLVRLFIIF